MYVTDCIRFVLVFKLSLDLPHGSHELSLYAVCKSDVTGVVQGSQQYYCAHETCCCILGKGGSNTDVFIICEVPK